MSLGGANAPPSLFLEALSYANHTSGIPTQQGIHAHFHAKGDIVFPRCGTGYGSIQNLAAKTSGKLGFHFPNKLDFVSNCFPYPCIHKNIIDKHSIYNYNEYCRRKYERPKEGKYHDGT